MKKAKKTYVLLCVTIILLVGYFVFATSPLLFGIDFPTDIKYFFKQPNTASDSLGWNLVLVNYENYIPRDFNPPLKELANGQKVDSRMYPYLKEMFGAAEQDGVYMEVVSGYRTKEKQQSLMNEKILFYISNGYSYSESKKLAEKWVALEGTSEHQLGLAVDINQDPSKCSADKVYNWLLENAHKYGFIKRYPAEKIEITKIANEPWHYRYVGEKAAKEMLEKNMCLEEYVEFLENNFSDYNNSDIIKDGG